MNILLLDINKISYLTCCHVAIEHNYIFLGYCTKPNLTKVFYRVYINKVIKGDIMADDEKCQCPDCIAIKGICQKCVKKHVYD